MKTSTAFDIIEQGRAVRRKSWDIGVLVAYCPQDAVILEESETTIKPWIPSPDDLSATDWIDLGVAYRDTKINWDGYSKHDERLQEFGVKMDAVRSVVKEDLTSYERNMFSMQLDTAMLWGKQSIESAIQREKEGI